MWNKEFGIETIKENAPIRKCCERDLTVNIDFQSLTKYGYLLFLDELNLVNMDPFCDL